MLTSFGCNLIVHSVSVSLRILLLDRSNAESICIGGIERAPVSPPEFELSSLSFGVALALSSVSPSGSSTRPSVCGGSSGLLTRGSLPRFCFLFGGLDSSIESLCNSVTSGVCSSFWLVTSPMGRRAAFRAANALTARSVVRSNPLLDRSEALPAIYYSTATGESQASLLPTIPTLSQGRAKWVQ